MAKITLVDWDRQNFGENRHTPNTLRSWARKGLIQPAPILVGREYRVEEDAVYVPPKNKTSILHKAKGMQEANLVDSLKCAENDPEMLEILHG